MMGVRRGGRRGECAGPGAPQPGRPRRLLRLYSRGAAFRLSPAPAPCRAGVSAVRRRSPGGGRRGVSAPAAGRPARSEAGLSLVEAVVALVLTLVVMAGLYGAVRPALRLNRSLPAMADAQQRLRHAFDRLHADLMAAGRGTARVEPGPLPRLMPAVVPYRVGRRARAGEHQRVRSDAVTVLSVPPEGGAETRLVEALSASAPEAALAPAPGCAGGACGYRAGDLVVVFDHRPAWGLFRVRSAGGMTLRLDSAGPAAAAFGAGAVVAPIEVRHYYLDEERRQLRRYDGWRGDFPLLDGAAALEFRFFGAAAAAGAPCGGVPGAPRGRLEEIPLDRFTDGPWCGPAGSPFDADLLRVRAIGLDIGVEGAAGGPPAAGAGPGGAGALRHRAAVVVAPPNLQIAGTRAPE